MEQTTEPKENRSKKTFVQFQGPLWFICFALFCELSFDLTDDKCGKYTTLTSIQFSYKGKSLGQLNLFHNQ
jgi:hypothetical protein